MNQAIRSVIEKHVSAYGPTRKGYVIFTTASVQEVARELGIPHHEAYDLVECWIDETFIDHTPTRGSRKRDNHVGFVREGEMEKSMTQLSIQGNAGDPIWIMCDGEEPSVIGVRLDCGDAGCFYLTRKQAGDLSRQLLSAIEELGPEPH